MAFFKIEMPFTDRLIHCGPLTTNHKVATIRDNRVAGSAGGGC